MSERQTAPLRVLHAAVSMNPSAGVIKQMEWEQRAAEALGLPWSVVIHTPHPISSPVVNSRPILPRLLLLRYIALRLSFYRWLLEAANDFDLIILRHSVHDVFEVASALRLGHKMLTMHHTMEIPELRSYGYLGPLRALFEVITGKIIFHRVAGIVAVTEEVVDYERARTKFSRVLPIFVSPNGVAGINRPSLDERTDIPEILFVASYFSSWHGLDLLLDAASRSNRPCRIHVVGTMCEVDLQRCALDPRFVFHGPLNTLALQSLMGKVWCGLSSFALERKGMQDACTLKVREYLEAGLPVFAGHRDSGLPADFKFFRKGQADLDEIINFAEEVRFFSREVVNAAAMPYISKQILLQRIYKQLQTYFLSRPLESG